MELHNQTAAVSDSVAVILAGVLSRAVEEGGTLMSPLIPWNAGGAFVISALGLGVMDGNLTNLLYIPLAFACWTAPLIGVFYALTGLFSPKATDQDRTDWEKSGEDIMDLGDHALANNGETQSA